ncbi:MAG: hypothetical protein J6X77_01550 [Bacteroidales bacterium]|nr:hypothetical protein [Bacteroidales bacterium]
MSIKFIVKATVAIALTVFAFASCNHRRHDPERPDDKGKEDVPEEQVTAGLSVSATYLGDYYNNGFYDYILLFQIGEIGEDGYFTHGGVELSLDILTGEGGPSRFPAGIYEITNDKLNSAGIIPSIPDKDEEGNDVYGDTRLYTEQDAENYWLEPLQKAHLEVAVNGAQYTISVQFTVDGEDYSYLYKGALSITDRSGKEVDPGKDDGPQGDYDFKANAAYAFNNGHAWEGYDNIDEWTIELVTDADDAEWISIEFEAATTSNHEVLPTGTFVIPADFYDDSFDFVPGVLCPYYVYDGDEYGTMYIYGYQTWFAADSGNLQISQSGDNYTIALTFYTDEESGKVKVTSTYTGTVEVDASEYYDGDSSLTVAKARKTVPSIRKATVKKNTNKREVKSACRIAGRLS